MHTRPAREEDLEQLLRLQRRAFREVAVRAGAMEIPPMTQTMAGLRADLASHLVLVHEEGGEVVGSVRARVSAGGTCEIARLMVDPARSRPAPEEYRGVLAAFRIMKTSPPRKARTLMQSTNPLFTRSEQFTHAAPQQQYGQQPYGAPAPYQTPTQPTQGVMTIDDVITKTAITIGTLVAVAAVTFMFLPLQFLYPTLLVSGIVGFVSVLLVAFRRKVNPAFVLAYAAIEGVFIGAFSLLFATMFDFAIVTQAVLGTFVAAGATLAAYKFLRIKVTSRFRKVTTIATFSFLGLVVVNLLLSFAGIDLGIRSIGGGFNLLAVGISLVAVVLAVFNLILDFDFIEQGIRNRLPASESWRGALGLTVTMVWLYTELLRILSYFRSN